MRVSRLHKPFKNTKMELACPHAGGVLQEAQRLSENSFGRTINGRTITALLKNIYIKRKTKNLLIREI